MGEKKNALVLVVSAPSGAGKSTLCNRLVKKFPDMAYSISCTTRAPRGEEKNGKHYYFISREEFLTRVQNGEFIEYAEVHGNLYGTMKSTVRESLAKGVDLVMDIDVQGASQIRCACEQLPEDDPVRRGFVDIFISPPSMKELRSRLSCRATDAEEVIEKRMQNAQEEMEHKEAYQHLVINDVLADAEKEIEEIIFCERKKRT